MSPDLLDVAEKSTALAPASDDGFVTMIERLAANKDVDVTKLERLIAMQERILDRNAETAFNGAFAAMQDEIPEIDEKGRLINHKTGQLQSTYAKNEDIQKTLRPILQKHGFALSFRTEWPDKQSVRVIGILTHREGHSRQSEFLSSADDSGNKNAIQALGSTISYGHRYTTTDLLNITSRGTDDDGAKAGQKEAPQEPDGYTVWLDDLTAVADEGEVKLRAAWDRSKPQYRSYLTKNNPLGWAKLKAKSTGVK